MTRVALYARYSSEGQRETSITDQFRNCEHYAAREGWKIAARFHDNGVSGTMDEKGRPGFRDMMEAARANKFDALLVDDLSRLSRDSMKTEEARRLFVFLGIRLVGISDGIDTANKGAKLLSGVKGIMNDVFLDDLREKTHRGLAGQALKGNNCGGRAYGYKHVPIEHPTEKDEYGRPKVIGAKREIDAGQAKWVKQIFAWYVAGQSPRWIAGELNRLKVPAPGAGYRRKVRRSYHGTWSASVLHGDLRHATGILSNPLYIGRVIWNRRTWVRNPETKKKVPRLRPESEWIMVERPELRIIEQVVWGQAQAKRHGQQQPQRPGRGPKFVLSGLLKCGAPVGKNGAVCGANYVKADYYRYACASHLNRRLCVNDIRVPQRVAESRLLEGIKRDLFSTEGLDLFIKETTRLLVERARQRGPERDRTARRLAEVEREIVNIMTAIKAGIFTESTKGELEKAEGERTRLQEALAASGAKADKVVAMLPRAKERYQALVENLGSLRDMDQAREQLRTLLGGEIKLVPTGDGHLEAELVGHYGGLVKLAVGGKLSNVVAGEGFEPSTFGL